MKVQRFEGTILNLDGVPDSAGDIFSTLSVVDIPTEPILVTHGFTGEPIGKASLMKSGKQITYNIELFEPMDVDLATQLYPAVGGSVLCRKDNLITACKLTMVSISSSRNTDPRIERLK